MLYNYLISQTTVDITIDPGFKELLRTERC